MANERARYPILRVNVLAGETATKLKDNYVYSNFSYVYAISLYLLFLLDVCLYSKKDIWTRKLKLSCLQNMEVHYEM